MTKPDKSDEQLVEQLRIFDKTAAPGWDWYGKAAEAIERLQAELAKGPRINCVYEPLESDCDLYRDNNTCVCELKTRERLNEREWGKREKELKGELAEARAEKDLLQFAVNSIVREIGTWEMDGPGGAVTVQEFCEALAAPVPEPIPHRFRPSYQLQRGCALCGKDPKHDIHREEPTTEREAERRVVEAAMEWHERHPGSTVHPAAEALEKACEALAAQQHPGE